MRKSIHLIWPLVAVAALAMAGAGCTAKMKANYHLRRANSYFDTGHYDKAVIEYENVLRNNLKDAQAWGRLGTIFFEQGRLVEAAQFLRQARQLNTNDLEVHLKLSMTYLQAGRPKEAQDEAELVMGKNPRDAQAPILLAETVATNQVAGLRQRLQHMMQAGDTAPLEAAMGVLSLRERDLKTAEAAFKRAVALDPKNADAYSGLGNVFVAREDLKQAGQAFKTAAALAPPRSGKMMQYAQFKMATGDSAGGKQLLEDVLKKAPDYLPAWMSLAQIAAAENRFADGIALLGNILNRDPWNLEATLLKSRLEVQLGKADVAVTDLERLTKVYPQVPAVFYQLAQAHLASNASDEAVKDLNQTLTLDPKYSDAILLLADIQIDSGMTAPAIASLQQLLKQHRLTVPARLLLAKAYSKQGNLEDAVQIYQDLEAIAPTNAVFPLLLGTTLVQQKNNAGARTAFEQSLKLAPDNSQALEQLVNLDLAEKQYAVAEQRVRQKLGLNPRSAALQVLLANVMVARGDTNQAESALAKAIELQPESSQAYLMLAQLHAAANLNQKALADLQSDLAKNPKDAAAFLLLGMTYEGMKDYQRAGDAYEKLLDLATNNVVALNNLACLDADHLGRPDKALELARRARDLAPSNPAVADTLGWILCQKGQYASALSLLQESAARLNAVPEVQFHLGKAFYMMGDEANARTSFQRAVQLTGDFPDKPECNECLSVIAVNPQTAGADKQAWLERRVAGQPNDSVAAARLAAIYQREGTADKAIATYEAALKAYPQNVTASVNLALLYAPKDPAKAFNLAKTAYNLAPKEPLVLHTLGRMAFLTGDYKWSLSLMQLAAQAQPQNPGVLYDLGASLYSEGKVPEARASMHNALQTDAAFAQADDARRFLSMVALADAPAQALAAQSQIESLLKSVPNYVPALMVKAIIAEQKPDLALAEQTCENVLKLYPDFAPAQKKLASLYVQDPKDDAKALPLAVKARAAFPADPDVARTLGILVYRQGDYSRAASLLQESARQRTTDAELMYYLGMAQYRLKQNAASKTMLQRALDLKLSGTLASDAKRVLAELK